MLTRRQLQHNSVLVRVAAQAVCRQQLVLWLGARGIGLCVVLFWGHCCLQHPGSLRGSGLGVWGSCCTWGLGSILEVRVIQGNTRNALESLATTCEGLYAAGHRDHFSQIFICAFFGLVSGSVLWRA
jgi:hypothetical protein